MGTLWGFHPEPRMCFSASASFTASAVLIPLGLYSNHLATRHERPDYKPLALVPFFSVCSSLSKDWSGRP